MTTIDAGTLRRWLDEGRPVIVLDVRRADDRVEWAIPGGIHVDAFQALKAGDPAALSEVDLPVDRPAVTVCGQGHTSRIAGGVIRYTQVGFEAGDEKEYEKVVREGLKLK
jgi:rhodanese-related sulfurtransferase